MKHFALFYLAIILGGEAALAQPIVPANDGTGTQVNPTANEFQIDGGSRSVDGANLFHSFQEFGLDSGQVANFLASPEIHNILGRVVGGSPSEINGLIRVTGGNSNLFLMNPAGIIFGSEASLNIPADFTATTATGIGFGENNWFSAIGQNDWGSLVGNPNAFDFSSLQGGAIINEGHLALEAGGNLRLLGGTVINAGTLEAPEGQITLAAVPGKNILRMSHPDNLLSLDLPSSEFGETINPASLPELLTGGNSSHASRVAHNPDGSVQLSGSQIKVAPELGTAIASGSLDVSGATGGEVNILGSRVASINAKIDASGNSGGGTVLIGGNFRGAGTLPNSQYSFVGPNSTINADALGNGDGGRVALWADDTAQFFGKISARGGLLSGNGGFVEVSGKERLVFRGDVDASAINGAIGTLLLDPTDLIIESGSGDGASDGATTFAGNSSGTAGQILESDGTPTTIYESELEGLPATANVILEATNDITIKKLTLDGELTFAPGPGGSVTFTADSDGNGAGSFAMDPEDQIRAEARDIEISGASISVGSIVTNSLGSSDAGDITLTAHNGNITTGSLLANAFGTGRGGSVTLRAMGAGNIDTNAGKVQSGSANNNGADIRLSTQNGSVTTGELFSGTSGAGTGGNITVNARTGSINTRAGWLISESLLGDGGDISLTAQGGNIATAKVTSETFGAGIGGDIAIEVLGTGNIDTSAEQVRAIAGKRGGSSSSNAGNITLTAPNGSVTTSQLLTFSRDLGRGGNITVTAMGNINTSAGKMESGSVRGDGGNIALSAQDGNVTTSHLSSISLGAGTAGDITVRIAGSGNIDTSAGKMESGSVRGDGGNIALSAQDGNVTTSHLSSISLGAGTAGDITVRIAGSGDISSTGNVESFSNSGNGGKISLTTSDGGITTTAQLNSNSRSGTGNAGEAFLSAQNGDIIVGDNLLANSLDTGMAGNITLKVVGTGRIDSSAGLVQSASNNGNGGDIYLSTSNGNITTRELSSGSAGAGAGGNITVNADSGSIDTSAGQVISSSDGNGGNIALITRNGSITTSNVTSDSRGTGTAGNITIQVTHSGNIDTSDGDVSSVSSDLGKGIFITTSNGSITTARLDSSSRSAASNAGDIVLSAQDGDIVTKGDVIANAFGTGSAGNITVTASGNGNVDTSDGLVQSISVSGNAGAIALSASDGSITTRGLNSIAQGAGTGGDISVKVKGSGNVDTSAGDVLSWSTSNHGGRILMSTSNGGITTADVGSWSFSTTNNAGEILFSAQNGSIITNGDLLANSLGTGKAGNITLKIMGNGSIDTSAGRVQSASNDGNGGEISLTAPNGNITTGELFSGTTGAGTAGNIIVNAGSGSIDTSAGRVISESASGNGGSITLVAQNGSITTGKMTSESFGEGTGGNITVEIVGIGDINTSAGQVRSISDSASAGEIYLRAKNGNIITSDILSFVRNVGGIGGNITIEISTNGSIDTTAGQLQSVSNSNDGGDINLLVQNGNITTANVDSISEGVGTGGDITLTVARTGGIDTSAGGLQSFSRRWNGGNIYLSTFNGSITTDSLKSFSTGGGIGGNITVQTTGSGDINTSSGEVLSTSLFRDGGSITLSAQNGNVTTGELSSASGGSGTGGNITVQVTESGNVDTSAGRVLSFSATGDGGVISLSTQDGSVITEDLKSSTEGTGVGGNIAIYAGGSGDVDTSAGELLSTSKGDGGDIIISAAGDITTDNLNTQGSFDGGNIKLQSGGTVDTSAGFLNSLGGNNGGSITIDAAGNINTSDIAVLVSGFNADSGSIDITSTGGNIDTSLGAVAAPSANGDGGNITLEAPTGSITVSTLNAISTGAGIGGALTFNADDLINIAEGEIATNKNTISFNSRLRLTGDTSVISEGNENITINGSIDGAHSLALDAGEGIIQLGGAVGGTTLLNSFEARSELHPIAASGINISTINDITASNIISSSGISLQSQKGDIVADILDSSAEGSGGDVTLEASNITLDYIDAQGGSTGGDVDITVEKFLQITDSFADANNIDASISTAGGQEGGSIIIRHGGDGQVPFIVGDATTNGTAGAITRGTGPEQTILPTEEYLYIHTQDEGNVQIISVPEPSAENPETEIKPESESQPESESETEAKPELETKPESETESDSRSSSDAAESDEVSGSDEESSKESNSSSTSAQSALLELFADLELEKSPAETSDDSASFSREPADSGSSDRNSDSLARRDSRPGFVVPPNPDVQLPSRLSAQSNLGSSSPGQNQASSSANAANSQGQVADSSLTSSTTNSAANSETGSILNSGSSANPDPDVISISGRSGDPDIISIPDASDVFSLGAFIIPDASDVFPSSAIPIPNLDTSLSSDAIPIPDPNLDLQQISDFNSDLNASPLAQTNLASNAANNAAINSAVNSGNIAQAAGGTIAEPESNPNLDNLDPREQLALLIGNLLGAETNIVPNSDNGDFTAIWSVPEIEQQIVLDVPSLAQPGEEIAVFQFSDSQPEIPAEAPEPEIVATPEPEPVPIPEPEIFATPEATPEAPEPAPTPPSREENLEIPPAPEPEIVPIPEPEPTPEPELPAPPNVTPNLRDNIGANLEGNPDSLVEQIDQLLEEQIEQEAGENLTDKDISAENIRTTLKTIERETGTKAVVVYALTLPAKKLPPGLSSDKQLLTLVLVMPEGEPIVKTVELEGMSLRRNIQLFSDALNRYQSSGYLPLAQKLYGWLIEPLEKDLQELNLDTLIFAMDAGLRQLPLAALHDGDRFLVEQYSLGSIPSMSLTDTSYKSLKKSQLLAMGASEFPNSNSVPLPAVPLSLATIVDNEDSPGLWPGKSFLNREFTLANLEKQLGDRGGFKIIHLATHAGFNPTDRHAAYIELWDGKVSLDEMRKVKWYGQPAIELLVLSACETGIGSDREEMGFAGLAVRAGVKSALASLWQVDDMGTLAIMGQFYRHLRQEKVTIKAEALRRAQLAILRREIAIESGLIIGEGLEIPIPPDFKNYNGRDLSHPYYWASFTIVGSPW